MKFRLPFPLPAKEKGASAPPPLDVTSPPVCLARSLGAMFLADKKLEAVTIDTRRDHFAVATLGREPVEERERRVHALVREAREDAGTTGCTLWSGRQDCGACHQPLPDTERAGFTVRHAEGATTIARQTCPTAPRFWHWRSFPWPKVVPREVEIYEHPEEAEEWKPQLGLAILCGLFGLLGAAQPTPGLKTLFFFFAYLAGGWFTAQEVAERLRRRSIDVHFLMLAVAAGSAAIGAWGEGAILLFLFSLSGALEHFALGRTQREIQALLKHAPKSATILAADGSEQSVPIEQLRPGLRLVIRPGDQFPVDAEVVRGQTSADESNLTGESVPVDKRVGDTVLAGTLNQWGSIEAVVLRPATESALQRIIRLIREAQQQKAPTQRFTDKFGTAYTYGVLAGTALMFLFWWIVLGLPAFTGVTAGSSAFYRAMTLLVVASPCALVLSIPSAILAAIAAGARRGILFHGGAAIEKLAEVRVVAMDKTGTLTTGDLQVAAVESFPAGHESDIARAAVSLERHSSHPLARAITRHGKQHKIEPFAFEEFASVTGNGLHGRRETIPYALGRRSWIATLAPGVPLPSVPPALPGFSEAWVVAGSLVGRILLRDDVRAEAAGVVQELRRAGLHSVVLTGDRRGTAELLRSRLGVDDVRAELTPEDKVSAIRAFSDAGFRVAMIGDGVNDAPSLAAAHVGVAMGARGSDAALEQADVVLMNDRLENFLGAFRLSQRARRIIRQNLAISLGTVGVLVLFALFGGIPLTLGVLGHEGSTVIVVMNSLRLLMTRHRSGAASGR